MFVQLTLHGKPVSTPFASDSNEEEEDQQQHQPQVSTAPVENPYAKPTIIVRQNDNTYVMPAQYDHLKSGSTNNSRVRGVELFNIFAECTQKVPKFEDLNPNQSGFNLRVIGEGFCKFLLSVQYTDKDNKDNALPKADQAQ